MKQRFAILAILSLCCVLGTASASVVGSLLTGSSGNITVSDTAITWTPDSAALPTTTCPGAKACNGDVASASALMFTGCLTGVNGSAGCLTTQEGIEINNGVPLTPSTVIPEDKFLLFESHPLLDFKMTSVTVPIPTNGTNCAGLINDGDSCVIFVGSPILLSLTNGGSQTFASLSFKGVASDDAGVTFASNWKGGFSVTLGETPAQLQKDFCPGAIPASCDTTGTVTKTVSNAGSFFVTVIPEPSSFLLIGGGLIGLAGLFRRKKSS